MSAAAIVAAAQLSEMIARYRAAVSMPPLRGRAYARNPLRSISTLIARVATDPGAIGGGLCEFEVVVRAGHGYARLRCIAPAGIAMHLRILDMIRIAGAYVKRSDVAFFGVESISNALK